MKYLQDLSCWLKAYYDQVLEYINDHKIILINIKKSVFYFYYLINILGTDFIPEGTRCQGAGVEVGAEILAEAASGPRKSSTLDWANPQERETQTWTGAHACFLQVN